MTYVRKVPMIVEYFAPIQKTTHETITDSTIGHSTDIHCRISPRKKQAHGSEEGKLSHHQLSFMLSHSYISEGYFFGSKKWIAAPSIGFDYNYWFKKQLAIGIHTDLIKENFALEEIAGDKIIERSTPFALVPALTYKPGEHGALVLGMGGNLPKKVVLPLQG